MGQDLNRAWAETNKFLHSEVLEIKKQLVYYDNHSKYDLDMVLDIHAHTALTGLFVYGNSYDDVYRYKVFLHSPYGCLGTRGTLCFPRCWHKTVMTSTVTTQSITLTRCL